MMSIISINIIIFKWDARVCMHEDVDYYFDKPILPHSVTNLLIHVNVSPGSCNLNRLWRRLKQISLISNLNIAFTLVVRYFFSWHYSKRIPQCLKHPLSPNIQIQILHTFVHKLPYSINYSFVHHFLHSPKLFSWSCINIVRRKLMLVTLGLKGLRWPSPPTLNARYMK